MKKKKLKYYREEALILSFKLEFFVNKVKILCKKLSEKRRNFMIKVDANKVETGE